jgi:hypothetical protein
MFYAPSQNNTTRMLASTKHYLLKKDSKFLVRMMRKRGSLYEEDKLETDTDFGP